MEKKSPMTQQAKKRIGFSGTKANFRAITEEVDGQNVKRLRGYAILFDTPGRPWRGSVWLEKIDKKALDGVDFSGLVMLLDHNTTWVLGKVGKNMRAEVDDIGLFVEVTLGNTGFDDYVFDRVQREIIDGMSFWFDNKAMIATDWENKIDVILKINEVYEVSVVVFAAYDETVIIAEDQPQEDLEPDPELDPEPIVDVEEDAKKMALINLISQL